ncbi:MAG: PEP-CTERM sorting domain-containing protein [Thermoguttaceae bacterium]
MFSSRSSHAPTWTKVLGCGVILSSLCSLLLGTVVQAAPSLIINEYNCVSSKRYLDDKDWDNGANGQKEDIGLKALLDMADDGLANGSSSGRIEGNGGNWIELVIVEDHLNIQNWELRWAETNNAVDAADGADTTNPSDPWYGDVTIEQGIIKFSDAAVWADLRAGTILTISEKVEIEVDLEIDGNGDYNTTDGVGATRADAVLDFATDTSLRFDPATDDWWMHVSTLGEAGAAAPLITTVTNVDGDGPGNFSVGPDDWQVEIFDAAGISRTGGPIGEAITDFGEMADGVGDREAVVLKADPDQALINNIDYNDRTSSTFGMRNETNDIFQVFDGLRDWLRIPTDWLTTNTEDPDMHVLLVGGAVGEIPVPGPALFEFTDVGTGTDVTVGLIGSAVDLAVLDTTLGTEGLLYEAEGGLFNAFTFKPLDPVESYQLYLWDDVEGWVLDAEPILPGTEFVFDTARDDFLIWGVEVDPAGITADDFLTDLNVTSTTKGPVNVYVTPVPEPSSLAMLVCAALGLLLLCRRRR